MNEKVWFAAAIIGAVLASTATFVFDLWLNGFDIEYLEECIWLSAIVGVFTVVVVLFVPAIRDGKKGRGSDQS